MAVLLADSGPAEVAEVAVLLGPSGVGAGSTPARPGRGGRGGRGGLQAPAPAEGAEGVCRGAGPPLRGSSDPHNPHNPHNPRSEAKWDPHNHPHRTPTDPHNDPHRPHRGAEVGLLADSGPRWPRWPSRSAGGTGPGMARPPHRGDSAGAAGGSVRPFRSRFRRSEAHYVTVSAPIPEGNGVDTWGEVRMFPQVRGPLRARIGSGPRGANQGRGWPVSRFRRSRAVYLGVIGPVRGGKRPIPRG